MRAPSLRLLALCGGASILIAGCGKGDGIGHSTNRLAANPPPEARGVVGVSTKNTTRLGGADPTADAAAVAQAIYPGITPATRPQAVALIDEHDWPAALAASALAGAPLGAPLLYAEGDTLPHASEAALRAMRPIGSSSLGGAQVLSIGAGASVPGGYKVKSIAGTGAAIANGSAGAGSTRDIQAAGAAVEVLQLVQAAAEHQANEVIVVASDTPQALQMPAAELAAESGTPILFVTSSGVPSATSNALRALGHPTIYVIAPKTLHGTAYAALAKLGTVVHVSGEAGPGENAAANASNDPVENAISVSRFSHGAFGWGIHEAGHGLVFANVARPLDAPAAAPLSAHGDYGPLLLLEHSASVPTALTHYLSNIEPGYTAAAPPVREVYNHGWLIGDERAISALAQAELDTVLEIAPRQAAAGEQSVAEAE
ncbi:MAG TPA: cell wall-binding repeat-containing protein [Solirubrobacteraceae bacterium]|nr:cell wall-binding repeat-containing protein [Solirubrobacteraceae bacterium]